MLISPYITVCTLVVFLSSLLIGPLHSEGDQLAYVAAYRAVDGLAILDAFEEYRRYLDSAEIVHFLVIWIGSNLGVDKNLLMSSANALLAYVILKLFRKWRGAFWISAVFVLSNFYILVLYFTAERLKFSFIFVVLSFIYAESIRASVSFATLSILTHVQNLIIYTSVVFSTAIPGLKSLRRFRGGGLAGVIGLISIGLLFYLFGDMLVEHILTKANVYASGNVKEFHEDVLVMLVLFIASLYLASNKFLVVLVFVPIFVFLFILGSDRINMIGYLCFLYFGIKINRGFNIAVIGTSSYLFAKGLHYLFFLFTTGNGFGY